LGKAHEVMTNRLYRSEGKRASFGRIGSVERFRTYRSFKRHSSGKLCHPLLLFVTGLAALLGMAGCSTNGAKTINSQTPLISVIITQGPSASLVVGGTTTLSASVSYDIANAGVNWVAICGTPPNCGSFSPSHTASGGTTTYTAPLAVPAHGTVSLTALSTTDQSKAVAATVTITSTVTGITITPPLPASVPAGAVVTLGASVTGDAANLGVDWTATCLPANVPVTCSPSGLHSPAGGTIAFTVPQVILIPPVSLIGTSITMTALATADHSFIATASFIVTAPISINITQAPPATLLTNATAPVIAVVTNDTSNSGVTWSVSCLSAPCGTITPNQTASGVAATFTAPPIVPSPNPPPGFPVNITACATASCINVLNMVTVDIVAPIAVKITEGIPNNTIVQSGSAPLAASVTNDSANAGVDWTVTCGGAASCGSFSVTHTASGAPTVFTAPSSVPAGGTVTITATSTTDPTMSDQEIVNVTSAPPPNSLLFGRFVVFLSAKNSQNGPFTLGGVISGDGNGKITAGVFDLADASGNATPASLFPLASPSMSSYSIGLDGRGQIQLVLNTFALNGSFGVPGPVSRTGTITLSVVFVTPQHALLSETDDFGNAIGTLDLQNTADLASFQNGSAGLNGTYSLQLSGTEFASPFPGYFVAAAITTQTSGTSYTVNAHTADQSANGAITSVPFTAASQAFPGPGPNQNGEIVLSSVNLGLPTQFNLDVWLIDANHFVVTDWQDSFSGSPNVLMGGYLTAQPASPSLSGAYAFTAAGATTATQPQVVGGIFTCGSTGTLDVTPLGGTLTTNQAITAACAAPTSGRGLITIAGAGSTGISQFAAYPTLDQGIDLIELDGGSAGTSGPSGAGVALQQTLSAPIFASSFMGDYASSFIATTALGSQNFAAQIISDGNSILSGAADVSSFNSTVAPSVIAPSSNATLTGSFTASPNGRFPLTLMITPASGQPTPQITTLPSACYIVDASTCLLMGLDVTAPSTGVLRLQNTGL
jgi:hypothetical protein